MRSTISVLPLSLLLLRAATAQEVSPAAASLPAPIVAASPEEPVVALDELISRALRSNPQPQIAANNLEAARARSGAARAQLNPTLQVVPGIGGTRDSRNEEIILSQPLDLFGQRRAGRAVFEAQVRRALAEQTLAQRSLVVSVKNAAADLFAAQEAESLGRSQVAIARAFRDAAARRAQLGDVPPVQTQRAQLELDRAQIELDNARAQRLSRCATLNQIIGQAPESPLRVALPDVGTSLFGVPATGALGPGAASAVPSAGGVPSVSPDANSPAAPPAPVLPNIPQTPIVGASSQVGSNLVAQRASLLPGALQRPDILSAQASLEAARAQAQAIGRTRRPLIEVQVRRNSVFDSPSTTSLRAVITVPIFDFGSIKREQRAARFEAQAQEGQVALLRSQAAAQLESALVQLEQNRRTVARYRDSLVPQTLDLLRKTQIGYAAGASTFLEVLEAQRAARQIQTEYLQALVGVRSGEATLESAFGASVPATFPGAIQNPSAPGAPPGVAAPGTVPPGVVAPLHPAPANSSTAPAVTAPTPGGGPRSIP